MRFRFWLILVCLVLSRPALADQTDPRLDRLFEELRVGDAGDSDAIIARIQKIWSDSQSDTVDLLYERAITATQASEFDLAAALLDTVIGLSPSFSQAYVVRGSIRLRLGDQPASITDFTQALALEPRQYEARIALAEIMLAGGDERGAYDMLQRALEWNPHDDYARDRARKLRNRLDGQEI